MTELYGRNPILTDDVKIIGNRVNAIPHVNLNYIRGNDFSSSMRFVNTSGYDLLVLTADGMRMTSPVGGNRIDGSCYFIVTYNLGGNVELDLSSRVVDDPILRKQLDEIDKIITAHRIDPITNRVNAREVVVEFHYRVECKDIEYYSNGIWIPFLGVHLYQSTNRNGLCQHFGRSMYTEVIAFNNSVDTEVSHATGCGVVYYVNEKTNIDPILVCTKLYSGIVKPVYDTAEKPGLYVYSTGQRKSLGGESIPSIVHIRPEEFLENGVYRTKDELTEAIEMLARKLRSPKDSSEYKELLQVLPQIFPEFYKRYKVEEKEFDLSVVVDKFLSGMAAAVKIHSVLGSKNG